MSDSKKNKGLVRKIEDFLASYTGKTVLNYAYSWGAAVVILGTLFKLTHIEGANLMLFIGMGTEVLVFFISAFDRPYKSYKWESVFPDLKIAGSVDKKKEGEKADASAEGNALSTVLQAQKGGMPVGGGGTVIIGGGYVGSAVPQGSNSSAPVIIEGAQHAPITPGVEVSPEMEEATKAYLDQLKEMTDALTRFVDQTKSMGQDAEQINILNKNLAGINAIYEIQLRNISTQLGTIDEINEQTRKMAAQIEELNTVYARMLEAMTVNMKR